MKLITGIFAALLALNNATWAEDSATIKSFVKRSNGKLMVDGKTFRFSGANLDWLVLANDEFAHLGDNLGSAKNSYYPSKWMIDDAFATLVKMNGTVARVWSVGCQGSPLSIQPEPGKFNERALQQVDYVLDSAKRHGIRLVMTLCDNWDFYTGGRQQFLKWRGITDHSKFWTDPGCKADYKAYVAALVKRTNSLTGVAYKNDPTILCWESANEFASPPEWERAVKAGEINTRRTYEDNRTRTENATEDGILPEGGTNALPVATIVIALPDRFGFRRISHRALGFARGQWSAAPQRLAIA